MTSQEQEKEKQMQEYIENYIPRFIDAKKFKDAKEHPGSFVFSKMEIMQEIGWKNGTFYNRFKQLDILHLDFVKKYIKKKEDGDKVEKLIFSYEAFCDFLELYYKKDLRGGTTVNSNSQESISNSQESIKNESSNSQFDSQFDNTNRNQDADEKIELYKQIIKQKDSMIESLQGQVEELTNIIKVKEQKDLELARIQAITQQKQLFINDAEGNKRESFFARFFKSRKQKQEETDE